MEPIEPNRSDQVITAKNVDLTSCDRELVQYPEAIQPHGAMLTVDEQTNLVMHASANCAEFIGKAPGAALGQNIASVLGPAWTALPRTLHQMPLDTGPVNVARESFLGTEGGFNLFAHRCGGLIILELEKASQAPSGDVSNLYSIVRADIARLQQTKNLKEFFDLAVERIRAFTGYDRVMAYRFDHDGSGHVTAESRRDDLEAYLGLHYPATDIPAPARRLFGLSWIRHLPDVDYVPVPILAMKSPLVTGPVDMSFAILRSVSVMYTGYLKNMGVHSTMVMPLMKEGKLWGLISAMHHSGPRHIPHETRMAAEFLAHTLSLLMSAKEDAEIFGQITAMKETSDRLVQMLGQEADLIKALRADDTLQLLSTQIEAHGTAVASEDEVTVLGKTPPETAIRDLVEWIAAKDLPLFATDRLPSLHQPAAAYASVASGVLAMRVSAKLPDYVLWFRPEQIEVVEWAGNPRKPVEVDQGDGMLRLRPRNSFELWKESVRNRSTAWRDIEMDAVFRLAESIGDIVLERARKIERISRDLDTAHGELSGYADAASYELKEHLRGIEHLTTALRRRHGEVLDEEGRQQVATIIKLTHRMDSLVDAMLERAAGGKADIAFEPVDLDAVVEGVLQQLRRALSEHQVEVRRPSRLGTAQCNRDWVTEVFSNLITNAVAYSDKAVRWIEIGCVPDTVPVYYVRDNGIGIAATDQQLIFQMFRRLDDHQQPRGGAGIGLPLARKIVERHRGRIWVESKLGEGSTFYFTLGSGKLPEA